jgi:hypothetical protein
MVRHNGVYLLYARGSLARRRKGKGIELFSPFFEGLREGFSQLRKSLEKKGSTEVVILHLLNPLAHVPL